MKRLRPGFAIVVLAGAAAAAWAGDPTLRDPASNAAPPAVVDATAAPKKNKSPSKTTFGAKKDIASEEKGRETKDKGPDQPAASTSSGTAATSSPATSTGTKAGPKFGSASHSMPAAASNTKGAPALDDETIPLPVRKPAVGNAEQDAKPAPLPTEWAPLEIELAKARCALLFKGLDVVTLPEPPLRERGECGAPAPVRLVSIGKNPEVSLSPPPLVTCDMVAALHKWVTGDLRPLAKKLLAASLIKLDVMSDYSCRHAYGRVANKLSEHGHANALDIGGFVFSKGQEVAVLKDWGQTKRDIEKQIAAAKAAAEKAEAERIESEKRAQANLSDPKAAAPEAPAPLPPAAAGPKSGAPAGGLAKTTIIDGMPQVSVTLPEAGPAGAPAAETSEGVGLAPRHLGGPKAAAASSDKKPADKGDKPAKSAVPTPKATAPAPIAASVAPLPNASEPPTKMARFLRDAHDAACRIFGTTLGPEANDAHRNHFHVDMAERKKQKICD